MLNNVKLNNIFKMLMPGYRSQCKSKTKKLLKENTKELLHIGELKDFSNMV